MEGATVVGDHVYPKGVGIVDAGDLVGLAKVGKRNVGLGGRMVNGFTTDTPSMGIDVPVGVADQQIVNPALVTE